MSDECPHRRAPLSRGRLYRPRKPTPHRGSADLAAPAIQIQPGSFIGKESPGGPSGAAPVLLECAYHGWQFDGSGTCVRLPQLLPLGYSVAAAPGATATAKREAPGGGGDGRSSSGCSSGSAVSVALGGGGAVAAAAAGPAAPPRSCAGRAYRTAVAQGMVWVWYGNGDADESALPLDFAEQGQRRGEDWALVDVFTRDFPYDWETMVENVVDPAHVAFAHDGTGQGLDRHASTPLELQVLRSGPNGFLGRFRGIRTLPAIAPNAAAGGNEASGPRGAAAAAVFQPGAWSELEFRPPCLVSMRFSLPGKGDAGLVLYCVPLGKGRSRMIARLPRNFATGWLAGLQPRWAKHLPRMAVLDQDIDLLREQEAAMARLRLATMASNAGTTSTATEAIGAAAKAASAASEWRSSYVMPAPADRFVVQFRRWLDRAGGTRPTALPGGMTGVLATAAAVGAVGYGNSGDPLPREQVLDRYHSHVRSCSACRGALATLERLRDVCRLAGLISVAATTGLLTAAAVLPAASAPTAAAAAAAAGGGGGVAAAAAAAAAGAASGYLGATAVAAAVAAVAAVLFGGVAAWAARMVRRFHYTEEGRELRMNEDRWLRRLLFSGTNSFNSMVALTNKKPGK